MTIKAVKRLQEIATTNFADLLNKRIEELKNNIKRVQDSVKLCARIKSKFGDLHPQESGYSYDPREYYFELQFPDTVPLATVKSRTEAEFRCRIPSYGRNHSVDIEDFNVGIDLSTFGPKSKPKVKLAFIFRL